MIKNWQYQAFDRSGQEISGLFEGTQAEMNDYFTLKHLEVIAISPVWSSLIFKKTRIKTLSSKTLAVFFEDLANMEKTGMTINQMLTSIADCSTSKTMRHVIEIMKGQIADGQSLAESLDSTGAFPWIVMVTIKSGEQSSSLEESYKILAHYFRKKDEVQGRLLEAMVYPAIVLILLIMVMIYVGLYVIPKLKGFLPESARQSEVTSWVIYVSVMLQKYYVLVSLSPVILLIAILLFIRYDKKRFESILYHIPIYGVIKKETDLSYYFLNVSILLKNGMPLIKCLTELNQANNNIISQNFYKCRDYLFGGMSLWESLQLNPFFSSVVVFTIRRGEELAKLPEYCQNLSDYFNKRVEKRTERSVLLIQPALLIIAGTFLIIIAFAFLIPVYGSLNQISTGHL